MNLSIKFFKLNFGEGWQTLVLRSSSMLEIGRIRMILGRMVKRRIWSFVGKFLVIPLPRIVYSGVGLIVWPCIKVLEGIGLFNVEVLRQVTKMALTLCPSTPHTSQILT